MQHFFILLVSAGFLVGSVLPTSISNIATATDAEVVLPVASYQPQGFSARSDDFETNEEDDEFEKQAQTHLAYRQRVYDYSQEEDQEEAPRQIYPNRNVKQQSNYLKNNPKKPTSIEEEEESEEEEEEEPDRLSQLLTKSNFNCNSKNSGYYADESLNCEVFHYCQDNQRHSWICPEGFTFHQIHLICMPPSNENICQQSSKYHIVNDYLYKPINLQEHQTKPNVTLRYSDRYYPENYYESDRYEEGDDDDETRQRIHHHHRQPVQIGFNTQSSQQLQQQQYQQQQPQQQQHQQQQRPQQQQQHRHQLHQQQPQQQVQRHQPQQTAIYRKPVTVTTIQPQQLQPQIHQPLQQQRAQTIAPLATPTPYRFYTASPLLHVHQQQSQVYRTPEEINISLQQRRPQQLYLASTTPRYYEDEYLYERRK